jgi:polysaccharide export outer membrane protein
VLLGAVVGGTANVSLTNSSGSAGRSSALPEQMVDSTGRISVPFAGSVMAAGRTPDQIARDIEQRLRGQANRPQVVVRVSRNVSANVTVVGDVTNSLRVPLTAKGERLLDILAGAGGVRQPVGKTMIQITRGNRVSSLPLEQVIRDPAQNIRLAAGDVVTALFQPFSFTVLGASGTNAEINFEGTGLTLSQALGRIGGLRDERANPRGVFIFRLEDRAALGDLAQGQPSTPDGKIPVIYRLDLSNPANFFVAQSFPMSNRDVLYVSNAPLADFQKFVTMVSQLAITGLSVSNSLP